MSALSGGTKALLADFLDAVLNLTQLRFAALQAGVPEEALNRARGNKKTVVLTLVDLVEQLKPATAQKIMLDLVRVAVEEHHGAERAESLHRSLHEALVADGLFGDEPLSRSSNDYQPHMSLRASLAARKIERQRVLEAVVKISNTEAPTAIVLFSADDLASLELDARHIEEALHHLTQDGLLKRRGLNPTTYQLLPEGRRRFEEMVEAGFYDAVPTIRDSGDMDDLQNTPDPRKVFVVHGRNEAARNAMFTFLRALHLEPIEWTQAIAMTGEGAPYIGDVIDTAFRHAKAVVVLFTGDDEARLRPQFRQDGENEEELTPQARPNVLFEAGLAMGRHPKRTIFVELGHLRPFSDSAGRHAVRLGNNAKLRLDLADRLRSAGCAVDTLGRDWLDAGDFDKSIVNPH